MLNHSRPSRSGRGPLLSVRDLSVRYPRWRAADRVAVEDVSFEIGPGEVVGIVGESGCGKSSIASAVAGSMRSRRAVVRGQVSLNGTDLLGLRASERARNVGVVQHSTNSAASIGAQMARALRLRGEMDGRQVRSEAVGLLHRVGVADAAGGLRARPGQLPPGIRQRAQLAVALARGPRLVIADEPTTALDVTVQAQILQVMREVVAETGVALLLLTHDLAVVAGLCDRINVICAGRFVEGAERHRLFATPRHPYTHALIGSVPRVDPDHNEGSPLISGAVDDHLPWTEACAFAPRCPRAIGTCRTTSPPAETVASRLLRCHNPVPATSA